MNDIKFRAWDIKEKIMLKSMVYQGDLCFGFAPELPTTIKTSFINPNLIKMQYTGLKDKNGVEIYEGDIMNMKYYNFDCIHISTDYSPVVLGKLYDSDGYNHCEILGWKVNNSSVLDIHTDAQVLGNIYENPDLLLIKEQ